MNAKEFRMNEFQNDRDNISKNLNLNDSSYSIEDKCKRKNRKSVQ